VRSLADLADIHFVRQGEPLGLGHAVSIARKHVGDEPFAVLLGDDVIHERVPLLQQMIAAHVRLDASVIALIEVEDPSLYGCAETGPLEGDVVRVQGLVEKPPRVEAKSNLAVIGRYVFTPQIFEALEKVEPGAGGELQLTDAIGLLLAEQPVYGFPFEEGRYDAGNKLDYLRATVELAAEREDLGPAFRAFLKSFVGGLSGP
jgi:UTP--glucose-1-phosphate uridylyltransferase